MGIKTGIYRGMQKLCKGIMNGSYKDKIRNI